jgi:hypothetical protein
MGVVLETQQLVDSTVHSLYGGAPCVGFLLFLRAPNDRCKNASVPLEQSKLMPERVDQLVKHP